MLAIIFFLGTPLFFHTICNAMDLEKNRFDKFKEERIESFLKNVQSISMLKDFSRFDLEEVKNPETNEWHITVNPHVYLNKAMLLEHFSIFAEKPVNSDDLASNNLDIVEKFFNFADIYLEKKYQNLNEELKQEKLCYETTKKVFILLKSKNN